MEPILNIKQGKSEFVFYPERIEKINDGKVVLELETFKIKLITYNSKFTFKDFFTILFFVRTCDVFNNFPKALVIRIDEKPHAISIKVKNEDYKILKEKFLKEIQLV